MILRDGNTPLIESAKELGLYTLDGVPMVVYQGVEAFWLLYGCMEENWKKRILRKNK